MWSMSGSLKKKLTKLFLLNNPFFIQFAIFVQKHWWSMIFWGGLKHQICPTIYPKPHVHPNMSRNKGSIMHVSWEKNLIFTLKKLLIHEIFIGNLKPWVHLNVPRNKGFSILHAPWKKTSQQSCFHFWPKKRFFTAKMMVWRKNVYALKSIHHYPWFDM